MFIFKEILTALILMNSDNAAVLNMHTFPERRATQSCHGTDHFLFCSYSVWIGVPYISAQDLLETLKTKLGFDGMNLEQIQERLLMRSGASDASIATGSPIGE